jgi:hypothetical protein
MKCPACRETNSPNAKKCNCGFAFWGPQTDSVACLASIEKSLRAIRGILVWWFVLGMIGAVLWLIVTLANAR